MKKSFRIAFHAVNIVFTVAVFSLIVILGALCARRFEIPVRFALSLVEDSLPSNITVRADSVALGLRGGLLVKGLELYDKEQRDGETPMAAAEEVVVDFLSRNIRIVGARYPRLPDSYYAPGNHERNEPVEAELPSLTRWSLMLVRPDILAVRPAMVSARVLSSRRRLTFDRIILDWPDKGEKLSIDGFCYIDLKSQQIYGEVRGLATQPHIRPMLEALDVPIAFPYFDGFTEVPKPVPSWCGWDVNLVNNDFDLRLDLKPKLGKYNGIQMDSAKGKIHLHIYTRGNWLNYRQTIGPISAKDPDGRTLDGTVVVTGTNGYNVVDIEAQSTMPVADVLRIGGFTGEYVSRDVVGESKCKLQFRFPRSMTNNYEVLNGSGHVEIRNGQLMRMKGFRGLLKAMPSIAPAVSWFTDSTQATCDYVIENGVVKSDNTYIEGSTFSIKMYGQMDTATGALDYTVRVQFTKKDSIAGMILHPLTWPFTKLLLEFKLTGTADNPKWEYISVLDRVLDAIITK